MERVVVRSQISGTIYATSSKSYAQRALAAALLSEGTTELLNMELCDDTQAALLAIQALGAVVDRCDETTYLITGGMDGGRLVATNSTLDVGESGLSARMFAPIAALCDTPLTIMGHGSLLTRPQGMMIDALRALGVEVESNEGLLPITLRGPIKGGRVEVDGSISSQIVTGLLMALPLCDSDTTLVVAEPTSLPYIDMTIALLLDFGIKVAHTDYREYYIEGRQSYSAHSYNIEGDWSSASCMLVAGAVAGEITVMNLSPLSLQADGAIINALSLAGAEVITTPNDVTVKRRELRGFSFDATHCPDLFPALVALAANCEGETTIRGTTRLVHKESNRAVALQLEFGKMGIEIDLSQEDVMCIVGGTINSATVESHGDHRIAMAVAVAALNSDDRVVVKDSDAVNKSYSNFWQCLQSVAVVYEGEQTPSSREGK